MGTIRGGTIGKIPGWTSPSKGSSAPSNQGTWYGKTLPPKGSSLTRQPWKSPGAGAIKQEGGYIYWEQYGKMPADWRPTGTEAIGSTGGVTLTQPGFEEVQRTGMLSPIQQQLPTDGFTPVPTPSTFRFMTPREVYQTGVLWRATHERFGQVTPETYAIIKQSREGRVPTVAEAEAYRQQQIVERKQTFWGIVAKEQKEKKWSPTLLTYSIGGTVENVGEIIAKQGIKKQPAYTIPEERYLRETKWDTGLRIGLAVAEPFLVYGGGWLYGKGVLIGGKTISYSAQLASMGLTAKHAHTLFTEGTPEMGAKTLLGMGIYTPIAAGGYRSAMSPRAQLQTYKTSVGGTAKAITEPKYGKTAIKGSEKFATETSGKRITGEMKSFLKTEDIGRETIKVGGRPTEAQVQKLTGFRTGYATMDGKRVPLWSAETTFAYRTPEGIITRGFPFTAGRYTKMLPIGTYQLGSLKTTSGLMIEVPSSWKPVAAPITMGAVNYPKVLKTGKILTFEQALGEFTGKQYIVPGVGEGEYIPITSLVKSASYSFDTMTSSIAKSGTRITHYMPVLSSSGGIGKTTVIKPKTDLFAPGGMFSGVGLGEAFNIKLPSGLQTQPIMFPITSPSFPQNVKEPPYVGPKYPSKKTKVIEETTYIHPQSRKIAQSLGKIKIPDIRKKTSVVTGTALSSQLKQTSKLRSSQMSGLKQLTGLQSGLKQITGLGSLSGQLSSQLTGQMQGQMQQQMTGLKQLTGLKTTTTSITTITPTITITTTPPPPPTIDFPWGPSKGRKTEAYRTEIFKGGKWKPVSTKPLTRGQAIKLGEEMVDIKSLSARFRIRPTGGIAFEKGDLISEPSPRFRGYKIRKGRRIPLVNEWIEKRKYRLEKKGFSMELPEITMAKKMTAGMNLGKRFSRKRKKIKRRRGVWF